MPISFGIRLKLPASILSDFYFVIFNRVLCLCCIGVGKCVSVLCVGVSGCACVRQCERDGATRVAVVKNSWSRPRGAGTEGLALAGAGAALTCKLSLKIYDIKNNSLLNFEIHSKMAIYA